MSQEILQCNSTKLLQWTYPTSAFSRIQTCIWPFVINALQVKIIGVTLFAAISVAPACCIRPNGYVSLFQDHRKLLDSRGCYKQGRHQVDATDAAATGPAPWCLGRLFIFVRYALRLRIQQKCHINFIANKGCSHQN